jgi:hypothetical protein
MKLGKKIIKFLLLIFVILIGYKILSAYLGFTDLELLLLIKKVVTLGYLYSISFISQMVEIVKGDFKSIKQYRELLKEFPCVLPSI